MKNMNALHSWLSATCEQITIDAIDVAILQAAARQQHHGSLSPSAIRGVVQEFVSGQVNQAALHAPELRFLPIIHLESGAFIAHEAVLHCEPALDPWQSISNHVAVLRADLELGVVRATLDELAQLPDATFVCFGVSHQLLKDPRLSELVAQYPGDRLVVEINGQTQEADFASLRRDLDRLRRHGIRVAATDIGTSTASLERIGAFEPEIIKIDIGPAQRLRRDIARRELVSEAVRVGRRFGAFVIAEGIESSEQITVAQELGVDAGQGILLGMS